MKELEKMDAEALSRLYMRVFNSDDGMLILEDLKNRCYAKISTISIDSHNIDPLRVAFNEGMRSVLLMIETRLQPITETEQEGIE